MRRSHIGRFALTKSIRQKREEVIIANLLLPLPRHSPKWWSIMCISSICMSLNNSKHVYNAQEYILIANVPTPQTTLYDEENSDLAGKLDVNNT